MMFHLASILVKSIRILICAGCGYQWDDDGEPDSPKGIFEMCCPVCENNMVQLMRIDDLSVGELPWWGSNNVFPTDFYLNIDLTTRSN